MKMNIAALALCAVLLVIFGGVSIATEQLGAGEGLSAVAHQAFDQYGYNDKARIFNGPADGVDRMLDGMVWGDPVYANDRLVMKWNAAWDACNDNGNNDPVYCAGAWLDNEWNGAFPGGSGSVWHYKIVWVGSAGAASPYWQPGGESVWGNYEVLMDQGVDLASSPVHTWLTRSAPNGYGAAKN